MSYWPRPFCNRKRCVKVCVECCVCGSEGWYTVKVPSRPVAVVASRTGNQAYTTTATTVIYNTVALNETISSYNNGCNSCNSNPCRCGKKKKCGCNSNPCKCGKKKKRCGSCHRKDCGGCGGCSSSSSSSSCYNPCQSNSCPPYPCPPYPCNPCPPNPCQPCNPCQPYPPFPPMPPAPYPYYGFCMFYDSTTGIATVPAGGGGYYVMAASIETDAINGFTAELRVSGQVINTKTVLPGQTQAMLTGNQEVYDYQQISVVIYSPTPANVTGGNLSIVKVA